MPLIVAINMHGLDLGVRGQALLDIRASGPPERPMPRTGGGCLDDGMPARDILRLKLLVPGGSDGVLALARLSSACDATRLSLIPAEGRMNDWSIKGRGDGFWRDAG